MRLAFLCMVLTGVACRTTGPNEMPSDPQRLDMMSLMLPQRIKIEPFTKIRSFNEDGIPDGILTVVRAFDRFGDPVKAIGLWYFELWTFQNASNEPKGQRLAFWDRNITTPEEVRLYWTRAQMYEFQLAWAGGIEAIQPGRKYILTATYRAPWDETFQDEYVIEFQLPPGAVEGPAALAPAPGRGNVATAPAGDQ